MFQPRSYYAKTQKKSTNNTPKHPFTNTKNEPKTLNLNPQAVVLDSVKPAQRSMQGRAILILWPSTSIINFAKTPKTSVPTKFPDGPFNFTKNRLSKPIDHSTLIDRNRIQPRLKRPWKLILLSIFPKGNKTFWNTSLMRWCRPIIRLIYVISGRAYRRINDSITGFSPF